MLCEIRFVAKGERYDKTLAKRTRDCADFAEALRWAAACIDRSLPNDIATLTAVRVRVIKTERVPSPVIEEVPPVTNIMELPSARRVRGHRK